VANSGTAAIGDWQNGSEWRNGSDWRLAIGERQRIASGEQRNGSE